MNEISNRTRPIVLLMYVLTFTTGIIDAVTILGLGDIFASLMTGNVVYIGLGLGGFEEVSPLRSAFAIFAFTMGAALAGAIANKCVKGTLRTWLLTICGIEVVLLLGAAWAGRGIGPDGPADALAFHVLVAIGLASVAMGLRNSTILRLSVPDLKVTVLTLSISGLGGDIGSGTSQTQKQLRRIGSIALIGAGAAFGAWLFFGYGVAVPLCVMAGVVALSTLAFSCTGEAGMTPEQLKG